MLLALLATSLVAAHRWEAVPVSGAKCADGSDYSFAFKKGTSNNLVVEFEAGGACWDAVTCGMEIYTPNVNATATLETLNQQLGIHKEISKNPVSEWNHVYINYCTGDIFLGDNVKDYGDDTGVIHHTGAANTRKVMEWVHKQVPSPEKVLTTGSSAGSLGSMIWAPHVMNHYEEAQHDYFGDSFVGVLTDIQWDGGRQNWKMAGAFAKFVPGMKEIGEGPYRDNLGADIIISNAKWKRSANFAHYTSNADAVQTLFYLLGYGTGDWTELMRGEVEKMAASSTDNIHFYIAPGDAHCSLIFDDFYTIKSEGVLLSTFFDEVIDKSKWSSLKNIDCAVNDKCTIPAVAAADSSATAAFKKTQSNITAAATGKQAQPPYQQTVLAFEKWIASISDAEHTKAKETRWNVRTRRLRVSAQYMQ
jgi:hypothetical protein